MTKLEKMAQAVIDAMADVIKKLGELLRKYLPKVMETNDAKRLTNIMASNPDLAHAKLGYARADRFASGAVEVRTSGECSYNITIPSEKVSRIRRLER